MHPLRTLTWLLFCGLAWACLLPNTSLGAQPWERHGLVHQADSLRAGGLVVQALAMYRQLLATPINGCQEAHAHAGVASIQWHAGNVTEAKSHLTQAANAFGTCPASARTALSLEVASLMAFAGQTQDALELLTTELALGPAAEAKAEVQLALTELHFMEGDWAQVLALSNSLDAPRAQGLALQAGVMMGTPLDSLPYRAYLRAARPSNQSEVLNEMTHLHTMLGASRRDKEALVLAQAVTSICDPVADPEGWTMAQLRIAVSAERAGRPLEALLAFHEAERTAAKLDDDALQARIARNQAQFEQQRGAHQAAYEHLRRADSMTVAMLHLAQGTVREARSFQPQPMFEEDPFELAASDALSQRQGGGAWPFAFALAALGLMASALRGRELKQSLRKERLRTLRLQRMVPDPTTVDPLANIGISEEGAVEAILTRPNRLDFDDIIASLEMDHGTSVEWELHGEPDGQEAPDGLLSLLSVTLKRLLEGKQGQHYTGHIQNDWHGINVKIEGPSNQATQELQRMFAGESHSHSWNPVLIQIEKLAGKFTVAKKPSGDVALTFRLPHLGGSDAIQRSPAN